MAKTFKNVFFFSCIAAIGGILFGYNSSVIPGVLLFVANDFSFSTFAQEMIVSILLIGALIGALAGGVIADYFGRKKTLLLTLILFIIGTWILSAAGSFASFLIGRFICGLAVGLVSMAAPLYIAEISTQAHRGALVSLNQFCITVGILLAFIITYMFAKTGNWRAMFAFAFIPIGMQLMGLFFLPESPSWLEHSKNIGGKRSIFAKSVRAPFLVGIGIAVFQAITGINTVIYYAPQIFQLAGYYQTQTALLASVLVGGLNVIATLFALLFIDRVGRRKLLIYGASLMGLSLISLGISFYRMGHGTDWTALIALLIYVGAFAVSLGPVTWLLITEVFPLAIRGRAMGVAVFSNWLANFFVSLTFLTLLHVLGSAGTFWLYAFICLIALLFVIKFVPETKGKTFEEIQEFWKKS